MIFNFGKVVVDIDVDATREYYSNNDMTNDCSCTGCKNYRAYTQGCDPKITEIFRSFGIDNLNYITEIIPFDTPQAEISQRIDYGGFYHVSGKIIYGAELSFEDRAVEVADNYKIYFENSTSLVPEDFPEPVLQICIRATIPWIISDENTYVWTDDKQTKKKFNLMDFLFRKK